MPLVPFAAIVKKDAKSKNEIPQSESGYINPFYVVRTGNAGPLQDRTGPASAASPVTRKQIMYEASVCPQEDEIQRVGTPYVLLMSIVGHSPIVEKRWGKHKSFDTSTQVTIGPFMVLEYT